MMNFFKIIAFIYFLICGNFIHSQLTISPNYPLPNQWIIPITNQNENMAAVMYQIKTWTDANIIYGNHPVIILELDVPYNQSLGHSCIMVNESIVINYMHCNLIIRPKNPNTNQGFFYDIPYVNGSFAYPTIFRLDHSEDVTFENLHFNAIPYLQLPPNSYTYAILDNITHRTIVNGCSFSNFHFGINSWKSDIFVFNNDFVNNFYAYRYYDDYISSTAPNDYKVVVSENRISHNLPLASQNIYFKSINIDLEKSPSSDIYIDGNVISGIGAGGGISILNDAPVSQTGIIEITNNKITGVSFGTALHTPSVGLKIENNTYSDLTWGIFAGGAICPNGQVPGALQIPVNHPLYPDPLMNSSISFVEMPNSIMEPAKNSGNTFNNCRTSFEFSRMNQEYKLIGLNVDGLINVGNSYPVTIRENLIKTPVSVSNGHSSPIILGPGLDWISGFCEPDGNNRINYTFSELSITASTFQTPNITVDATVSGLNTYGNYVIEFYLADSQGDLVEYLGNEEVTSTAGLSFSKQFNNVIIPQDGRIAATITSLGDYPGATQVGTSEVMYFQPNYEPIPCTGCGSFKPEKGVDYWVSAWVKVKTDNQVITYNKGQDGPNIELIGYGSNGFTATTFLLPSGEIIDGWQRMVAKMNIPTSGVENVYFKLNADKDNDSYFDDIRIHPFNASMKSYVYDGETFWLTSELDDNNYATFYEYDNEGGLVRIKKETSRGIVTIQETRSHTSTEE